MNINNNYGYKNPFIILISLSALSLFITLFLPYIREEGVYTISTLEMFYHHLTWSSTLFDTAYPRPPLYNWLIAAWSQLLGWNNILIAARLSAALATILLAATLGWFTQRLFAQRSFTLLAVAGFLSGDILLMRGWLAYSDPLFSLFIFAAIACLWIGLNEQKQHLIVCAALSICCAFLSKHFSAYVFYVVAVACLLWRHPQRLMLFKPSSIGAHSLALAISILWFSQVSASHGETMLHTAFSAYGGLKIGAYLTHLLSQPLDIIRHFAPLSLVAIYYLLRRRVKFDKTMNPTMITLALITFTNYLPYYLAPSGGSARYVMPLYPFIAILFAYPIWCAGEKALKVSAISLFCFLGLKILLCGVWLNYHLVSLKQQYQQTTKQLLTTTQNYPVYLDDYNFEELGLISLYDIANLSKKIITQPTTTNWTNAFMLSGNLKNSKSDHFVASYQINSFRYLTSQTTKLYLYCRGEACKKGHYYQAS